MFKLMLSGDLWFINHKLKHDYRTHRDLWRSHRCARVSPCHPNGQLTHPKICRINFYKLAKMFIYKLRLQLPNYTSLLGNYIIQ